MTTTNIWSPIECNFSPIYDYCCRKLIRLSCSDYLVIIDFVTIWYIYDFSKKKLMAIVHVNALDEIGTVSNIFRCHHTSKESLIYVFIDPGEILDFKEESFTDPSNRINIVSYVRVKLQISGNFSARVESKDNLKVGPYEKHYIYLLLDEIGSQPQPKTFSTIHNFVEGDYYMDKLGLANGFSTSNFENA